MIHPVRQGFLLLVLYLVGPVLSGCPNSYLDFCETKEDLYNDTEFELYNENRICDCTQVTFCFLVELSQECNVAVLKYDSDINANFSTQLVCNVSSVGLQGKFVSLEILNETGNELTVQVVSHSDFGRLKIICSALNISDKSTSPANLQWDIVSINPTNILIDSELKLGLIILEHPGINISLAWCFVKTPDRNVEVFSTSWVSNTQVDCLRFKPVIPGTFAVSLSYMFTPDVFDKSISVKVTAKNPEAQLAEYSYDFKFIYIYFQENIELLSTCREVFLQDSQYYFGVGFRCFIKGNIFVIKMGVQFKIVSNITLNVNNKVCQAGCKDAQFCLSAVPVDLFILKPKFPDPNLRLHINSICAANETKKYINVKVVPAQTYTIIVPQESLPSKKNQRKNLMFWRMIRKVQKKLTPNFVLQINATDIEPFLGSFSSLDNILDIDDNPLGSAASVSIFIQSSPSTKSLLAEANVIFCQYPPPLFRFNWTVNGEYVFENGKLLILRNLSPGKYIIKCMIVGYNSTDILGQVILSGQTKTLELKKLQNQDFLGFSQKSFPEGWTTAEVLTKDEEVFIVPMEMTVGAADDIFFRAVTWLGTPISWTCTLNLDEPCLTIDKKLVGDIIDLNSPNVSISAGILPIGSYTWAIENLKGSHESKVFIKDGNVPIVKVEIPSVFVKSSQEVVLNGTVGRVRGKCRAWWNSVRRKGFNYFDLNVDGVGGEIFITEELPTKEIPLVIPFSSENLEGAESKFYYLFELQVFCPGSSVNEKGSFDYVKVPIVLSDSPHVTAVTVEPLRGKAMATEFLISGGEAVALLEDYPLIYEWSYVDPCGFETSIKRGAYARNFTTYLPPGDFKLVVKVCDSKNTCSSASSSTVSVFQDYEFPSENFRKAREEIRYLMASGEVLEAFGLAITAFKSLALLAEPETRQDIFSVVEEGIETKIKDFTRKAQTDAKDINLFFDFIERAITVVKYFRKGSNVLNRLLEFKTKILSKDNINK